MEGELMTDQSRSNSIMGKKPRSTDEQIAVFKSRLARRENGCIEWTGAVGSHGYGVIAFSKPTRHRVLTHRLAYSLEYGEITGGLFVCHKCDNKKCCNPEHLFLGTQRDNVMDAVKKGRNYKGGAKNPASGYRHYMNKFKEGDKDKIKELHLAGVKGKDIAIMFGLAKSTISRAINERNQNV